MERCSEPKGVWDLYQGKGFKAPVQVFRYLIVAGREDIFMFSCMLCVRAIVQKFR
jgi:hypothetical protein